MSGDTYDIRNSGREHMLISLYDTSRRKPALAITRTLGQRALCLMSYAPFRFIDLPKDKALPGGLRRDSRDAISKWSQLRESFLLIDSLCPGKESTVVLLHRQCYPFS